MIMIVTSNFFFCLSRMHGSVIFVVPNLEGDLVRTLGLQCKILLLEDFLLYCDYAMLIFSELFLFFI